MQRPVLGNPFDAGDGADGHPGHPDGVTGLESAGVVDDALAVIERRTSATFDFDPRKDVSTVDDLRLFPNIVDELRDVTPSEVRAAAQKYMRGVRFAYVGDSTRPEAVRTRTLTEETSRIFRARVVNPRWIAAMRRHGYKGAFEMAATVDYLFGYDATAGVVDDWMYEKLASAYVFDETNRAFMEKSNPWALRGISERLLEAADRGLWEEPSAETLDGLKRTYLELEGDLEGDEA